MEISLRALRDFINRYAALALSMSEQENNSERKAELIRIHENCRQIAQYPPQDFYQALQLTYFIQLVLQIEITVIPSPWDARINISILSINRINRRKKITDDFVMELLENTWIKLLSFLKIRSWSHTRFSAGSPLYQNVTIGGQTVTGEDAVNELSYLILRSVGETKLTQPNLSIRYHKHISDEFMLECLQVIEKALECQPLTMMKL